MNLAALQTFQAVVRAGSITRGARAAGVSQSTASSHVALLEAHLATPLLRRTRSGVVPTEAGALLFERCDDVFLALDRIVLQIRDLSEEAVGTFVVGCHDSLGSYFLPTVLGPFLADHPRIGIELWNRSSAEVRQAVIDREVDLGLAVNADPHDDLVMEDAYRDRIEIMGPTELPEREARRRFRQATLVYPNRAPFTTLLSRLQEGGFTFGRLLPCGDLGLAKTLAQRLGFGLLPRRVALDGPGLHPVNPTLPCYHDQIHLLHRADLPRTRAFRLLRTALLDHARTL